MRRFADLHIALDSATQEPMRKLVSKARELGYGLIGISLPSDVSRDTISWLREVCGECSIDFATRVNLTPRFPNELLKSLKAVRRKFEIVSVDCFTKAVARQAAKDHRVDLLSFPSSDPRQRFFDHAEIRVASQGVAALEIDLSLILSSSGFSRARLLYFLRREAAMALRARFSVVICSHAADPLQLRGPYDSANLAALFGMDNTSALKALSTAPWEIVERNRKKLDSDYVARGVHVIRRGRDCDN